MLYEQRAPESTPRRRSKSRSTRVWEPEELRDLAPTTTDTYLAIDDRSLGSAEGHIVGVLTAVAVKWPRLDQAGRLSFSSVPKRGLRLVYLDETRFKAALDSARRSRKQVVRDIRIGDAFWVRGFVPSDMRWDDIVDVSASARETAKIALYGAVAPRLDREQARSISQLVGEQPPPEPPNGPTVGPTV